MARALIQVNGVDGSNDNVPINVLVQLNNDGNGGETTYAWTLVDQPDGAAVSLSSTSIQNPTFTPTKEGTYLLQLVVNLNLSTQSTNTAIVAVRQLKSNLRVPAAGETVQDSASIGYKEAVNPSLIALDTVQGDANRIVVMCNASCAQGMAVQFAGVQIIKSGLPGQATVPLASPLAAAGTITTGVPFGIIEGPVVGGGAVPSNLCYARVFGLVSQTYSGSPSVRAPVYVNATTSQPQTAATAMQIGTVVSVVGGNYQIFVPQLAGVFLGRQVLTAASGTWTPTPGTLGIVVSMIGGGGSGGQSVGAGSGDAGSAGGSSGVYLEFEIASANGFANGAYTVGAGGNNSNGGDTTLVVNGTTYTAKQGTIGGAMTATTGYNGALPGAMVAGSSGPANTLIGWVPGDIGVSIAGGQLTYGGNGGAYGRLGQGGIGVDVPGVGGNAGGYGAGGGGSACTTVTKNGGNGSAGVIIIDHYGAG